MKLYYAAVEDVYGYDLRVVANSPEECKNALIQEYKRQFGSFEENGFEDADDWLDYHGCDDTYFNSRENIITVGKAWTD